MRSLRARAAFASGIAHEQRRPLSRLRCSCALVEDDFGGKYSLEPTTDQRRNAHSKRGRGASGDQAGTLDPSRYLYEEAGEPENTSVIKLFNAQWDSVPIVAVDAETTGIRVTELSQFERPFDAGELPE